MKIWWRHFLFMSVWGTLLSQNSFGSVWIYLSVSKLSTLHICSCSQARVSAILALLHQTVPHVAQFPADDCTHCGESCTGLLSRLGKSLLSLFVSAEVREGKEGVRIGGSRRMEREQWRKDQGRLEWNKKGDVGQWRRESKRSMNRGKKRRDNEQKEKNRWMERIKKNGAGGWARGGTERGGQKR